LMLEQVLQTISESSFLNKMAVVSRDEDAYKVSILLRSR